MVAFGNHLFTACKRSLGQGNIFTNVCQVFCSQAGVWFWGGSCSGGSGPWGVPGPEGDAWSQGVSGLGGCLLPGGCLVETPQTATAVGSTHPTRMHSCYHPQRSWGKVMFLQASVILLTGGVGTSPPWEETPPSGSRHTPLEADTPLPPGADPPKQISLGQHPPDHTPETTPPQSRHPPRADPPGNRSPQWACCEIRSTRGRYTSYWNAILLWLIFKGPRGMAPRPPPPPPDLLLLCLH